MIYSYYANENVIVHRLQYRCFVYNYIAQSSITQFKDVIIITVVNLLFGTFTKERDTNFMYFQLNYKIYLLSNMMYSKDFSFIIYSKNSIRLICLIYIDEKRQILLEQLQERI